MSQSRCSFIILIIYARLLQFDFNLFTQMGHSSWYNSVVLGNLLAVLWKEKTWFPVAVAYVQQSKRSTKIRVNGPHCCVILVNSSTFTQSMLDHGS